jgi:CheY-like chemotaxis protein
MSLADDSFDEQGPRPYGLRVLVVDDNDDVADCLVMILERLGHLARGCCSGRDCLACLHEFRPDVVVLDLSMPALDGFDTCRQIRRTRGFEHVPVVACSALDPYQVQQRDEGCDFSHHLVKPVSSRQLQAALEEAVAELSA